MSQPDPTPEMDVPRIGDTVRFHRDGLRYQGTIMDIRPHLNDPAVRFGFAAVLGESRMFPIPFQRQSDGTWMMGHLPDYMHTEVINVF